VRNLPPDNGDGAQPSGPESRTQISPARGIRALKAHTFPETFGVYLKGHPSGKRVERLVADLPFVIGSRERMGEPSQRCSAEEILERFNWTADPLL
jgi:hypothetical protein